MSRSNKALKVFTEIYKEADSLKSSDFNYYYRRLMESIVLYLGKDTTFYTDAHDLWNHGNNDINTAKKLTDSVLKYIKLNGVTLKKNIIQNFSNVQLISWAGGIITTLFFAGFFVGKFIGTNSMDREYWTMQLECEKAKYSLIHFTDSIAKQNVTKRNGLDTAKNNH